MALQASGPISASQIRSEFGASKGTSVSFGAYRVSQTVSGLTNLPLDTGVPQSGPIGFSSFYSKKLNVVVDYTSSGSTTFSGTTTPLIQTTYNGYPVRGYLYYPTSSNLGSSLDLLVLIHPTIEGEGVGLQVNQTTPFDAAKNFLDITLNTIKIKDKIIFSIAYPQDDIPIWNQNRALPAQQFPGLDYTNFYLGDNIVYVEAAFLWAKNNLNSYMSSNGIPKTFNKIFTFGHSQGAYLVHRLNTMHAVDGAVSNAPGPIDFLDRCSGSNQTSTKSCRYLGIGRPASGTYPAGVGLGTTLTNPNAYIVRSLKNYLSGTLSPTLYTQALDDSPYQVSNMKNILEPGLKACTNCAPATFNYYSYGGHDSFTKNPDVQQDIRKFIGSKLSSTTTKVNGRSDYDANNSKVVVIGGFKSRPTNPARTKVWIHTNSIIGSDQQINKMTYCSLLTGSWDPTTDLIIDIGPSGAVYGAGGNGGIGGATGSSAQSIIGYTLPTAGGNGTSAIGIIATNNTIINNRGAIVGGGGGGGGSAASYGFTSVSNQWAHAGGSGGGGGRGYPGGVGGIGGAASGNKNVDRFAASIGSKGQDGSISSGGNGGNGTGATNSSHSIPPNPSNATFNGDPGEGIAVSGGGGGGGPNGPGGASKTATGNPGNPYPQYSTITSLVGGTGTTSSGGTGGRSEGVGAQAHRYFGYSGPFQAPNYPNVAGADGGLNGYAIVTTGALITPTGTGTLIGSILPNASGENAPQ